MTSKPSQHCRVVSWAQIGWLLKEWGRAAPETAGVPAATDTLSPGTHANTQLWRGHATHSPLWTLRTQSSDRKLAQNMRFSHPMGVAGLSFRTSRLGHRERSNRDPCLAWYYTCFLNVFFPFWNLWSHWHITAHRHRGPSVPVLIPLHFPTVSPATSPTGLGASEWPNEFRELFWLEEECKSKHLAS